MWTDPFFSMVAVSAGICQLFGSMTGPVADSGAIWDLGSRGAQELGRAAAHGLTGGIAAEVSGESFGSGFAAGFFASAAGSGMAKLGDHYQIFNMGNKSPEAVFTRTAVAAIVGGTTAEIGGGKFANGAMTAAIQHLFNAEHIYLAGKKTAIFYDSKDKGDLSNGESNGAVFKSAAETAQLAAKHATPNGDAILIDMANYKSPNDAFKKLGIAKGSIERVIFLDHGSAKGQQFGKTFLKDTYLNGAFKRGSSPNAEVLFAGCSVAPMLQYYADATGAKVWGQSAQVSINIQGLQKLPGGLTTFTYAKLASTPADPNHGGWVSAVPKP